MKIFNLKLLALVLILVSTQVLAQNTSNTTNSTDTNSSNSTMSNTTNATQNVSSSNTSNTSNVSNISNVSNVSNTSTDTSKNCSNPYFSVQAFQFYNLSRPKYLANATVSTNLTICKQFNNQSSCCDQNSVNSIADGFNNIKFQIMKLTSGKIKVIKDLFRQFRKINLRGHENTSLIQQAINQASQQIDNFTLNLNKFTVRCAQNVLQLHSSMLCHGCSANWGAIYKKTNGTLTLGNDTCTYISQSCFSMIRAFDNLQENSYAAFMNLTEAITTYIGVIDDPSSQLDQLTDNNSSTTKAADNSSINLNATARRRRILDLQSQSQQKCLKAIPNCQNCSSNLTQCLQCRQGTFLSANKQTCFTNQCQLIDQNCLSCNGSTCTICKYGYQINNNTCVFNPCFDLKQKYQGSCGKCSDKKTCTGCVSNFFFNSLDNQCYPLYAQQFGEFCLAANSTAGCTRCQQGYVLSPINGNNTTQTCVRNPCQSVFRNCATCNLTQQNNQICTSCEVGFTLQSNNKTCRPQAPVFNITQVQQNLCGVFQNSSSFTINCQPCGLNSTDSSCLNNPVYKLNLTSDFVSRFVDQSLIPANVIISPSAQLLSQNKRINISTINLPFIFSDSNLNEKLVKFMMNENIPSAQKLQFIKDTIISTGNSLKLFNNMSNLVSDLSTTNSTFVPQSYIQANLNSSKQCFQQQFNQMVSNQSSDPRLNASQSCYFSMFWNNDTNTSTYNICNQQVQINNDSCFINGQVQYNVSVVGKCINRTCVYCFNDLGCYYDTNKFNAMDDSSKRPFNKDEAVKQFKKDRRFSPVTARKVPDAIQLPDLSVLEKLNYTAPCQDINDCSSWFCSQSFFQGIFIQPIKIANPQDSNYDPIMEIANISNTTNSFPTATTVNTTNGSNTTNTSNVSNGSNTTNTTNTSNSSNTSNSTASQRRALQAQQSQFTFAYSSDSSVSGFDVNSIFATNNGLNSTVEIDGVSTTLIEADTVVIPVVGPINQGVSANSTINVTSTTTSTSSTTSTNVNVFNNVTTTNKTNTTQSQSQFATSIRFQMSIFMMMFAIIALIKY